MTLKLRDIVNQLYPNMKFKTLNNNSKCYFQKPMCVERWEHPLAAGGNGKWPGRVGPLGRAWRRWTHPTLQSAGVLLGIY